MWTCRICESEVEDDSWESCWKCSSSRGLSKEDAEKLRARHDERVAKQRQCLRCESPLAYAGTKQFHVGGGRADFFLGDLGELFVGREAYDVYHCTECGKVEFYVDGTGPK